VEHDPTPDQIQAACERIRGGWSADEKRFRRDHIVEQSWYKTEGVAEEASAALRSTLRQHRSNRPVMPSHDSN